MFKFIENLKIREIIYRYRDFKKEHPDFNEDQLCRLTIQKRLRDYPHLYNIRNNSDECIKSFMNDLFEKSLTLKYICQWFMEEEYPKYNIIKSSQDINGWRIRIKDLENRIEYLFKKIPGI